MSEIAPSNDNIDQVYEQIRKILGQARKRAWKAVNAAMATAYWEIGRAIVLEEQRGTMRAEYGKQVIAELSRRLSAEFGKGFGRAHLWDMRAFYLAYPDLRVPIQTVPAHGRGTGH